MQRGMRTSADIAGFRKSKRISIDVLTELIGALSTTLLGSSQMPVQNSFFAMAPKDWMIESPGK